MNRALMVWKLKLCLAALAAMLASAIAPQRSVHEPQVKEKTTEVKIAVDHHKPKAPTAAPAPARQPGTTDSRVAAKL